MPFSSRALALVLAFAYSSCLLAQQTVGPTLQEAVKSTSLTAGDTPFHALLTIGEGPSPYSGTIEVWWSTANLYRVVLTSPSFSQTETVDGAAVQQSNQGDFYPRWLQDFRLALTDPSSLAPPFQGAALPIQPGSRSCISRDDRPGGITNQLTWGNICFTGKLPLLVYVLTFNHSMEFSDFQSFGGKQISRTYKTEVEGYETVTAHLTKLEALHTSPELFVITSPTPPADRIATTFLSTTKAESLIDHAPIIDWPAVREGKTEGYMIVYARTDRSGQVRETSKHNSDQPGLEDFGIEQALRFKFKPIAVNGVRQQMETPLVLHFTSKLGDPIPVLSVDDMRKQILSCSIARTVAPAQDPGRVTLLVSVDEQGKVAGVAARSHTTGQVATQAFSAIKVCRFKPFLVGNNPTYYKGTVEVVVQH